MKIRKGLSLKENRSKKSLKENRSKKGSARAKQGSKDQGSRDRINLPLGPGMSPSSPTPGMSPAPKETASKRERRQPTTARGTTGSRKNAKKPKTPETADTNSKREMKSAKTKKEAKKEADKPVVETPPAAVPETATAPPATPVEKKEDSAPVSAASAMPAPPTLPAPPAAAPSASAVQSVVHSLKPLGGDDDKVQEKSAYLTESMNRDEKVPQVEKSVSLYGELPKPSETTTTGAAPGDGERPLQ